MEIVTSIAQWLREAIAAQSWLEWAQPLAAQTPDWALLAAGPGFLAVFVLVSYWTWPRQKRSPAEPKGAEPASAPPTEVQQRKAPIAPAPTPARMASTPTKPAATPTAQRVMSATAPTPDTFDIFLSYARKDNVPSAAGGEGWVTAFHRRLCAQHERYAGRPLRVFFDKDDIASDEDWERRIYQGLRSSSLFVAFLSPNYLASPVCKREWDEYLRLEHTLARGDDGIKQIYFAEIPNLFGDEASLSQFEEGRRAWIADMRRRNLHHSFDLRPWFAGGVEQLHELDAEQRIADLRANPRSDRDRSIVSLADQLAAIDRDIAKRLDKALLAKLAPGNLDASYSNFVGRSRELRQLHSALIADKVGVVGALHG
ncbi:MAG: hypothetical protein DCF16_10150, partial [Alphaproteobacteria bacterium]